MSQLAFPTQQDFLDGVAQAHPTLKWRELEKERIYGITRVRHVKTQFGKATIGRVVLPDGWERDVWLPERLAAEISVRSLPTFVRPLGLKASCADPTRFFHDYQLM